MYTNKVFESKVKHFSQENILYLHFEIISDKNKISSTKFLLI